MDRLLIAMVEGLVPVAPGLEEIVSKLRLAVGKQLFPASPSATPEPEVWHCWQVHHHSGKRCGHRHNDQAKAVACRDRLGEGWKVVEIHAPGKG